MLTLYFTFIIFLSILFFVVVKNINTSFFKISHLNSNSGLLIFSSSCSLLFRYALLLWQNGNARLSYFITNWLLSTNHRRIAVMYFIFTVITGFTGLILATVIRLELAYPGHGFLNNNAEKYLTIASLHAVVMVFFVVVPILFGAFGNFLLPTQLGIRDVAFPRLNSFMFWITPAGFVLLLHIIIFDKSYHLTYWLNYSELKAQLKRKYQNSMAVDIEYHLNQDYSLLANRLALFSSNNVVNVRNILTGENTPKFFKNLNNSMPTIFGARLVAIEAYASTIASNLNFVTKFISVEKLGNLFWKVILFCNTSYINLFFLIQSALVVINHQIFFLIQLMHISGLHMVLLSSYDTFHVVYRALFFNKKVVNNEIGFMGDSFLFQVNNKFINSFVFNDLTAELLLVSAKAKYPSEVVSIISCELKNQYAFKSTLLRFFNMRLQQLDFLDLSNLISFYFLSTSIRFQTLLDGISVKCKLKVITDYTMFSQLLNFFFTLIYNIQFYFFYSYYSFKFFLVSLIANVCSTNYFVMLESFFYLFFFKFFYIIGIDTLSFNSNIKSLPLSISYFFTIFYSSIMSQLDYYAYVRYVLEKKIYLIFTPVATVLNRNFFNVQTPNPSTQNFLTFNVKYGDYLVNTVTPNRLPGIVINPIGTIESVKYKTHLLQYYYKLLSLDYLNDWRCLKFEREIWRSIDNLSLARKHWLSRSKFYSSFYSPASFINKVSIWMPNHLIPGWAYITPYTSRLRYTSLGKVDVSLIVVLVASTGSVFSSINYVITYRYIGAPTFKNRKELRSFFVDALLVGSRMMIVANPALIIGILLLLSDRHFNTSVFDFSGGGDTILFQHLFWFFGHPEVYIVIIPCFGIMNSLLPYYLRKRLSGRLSLQFSMYTIAFMSFAVWGHHMYMVGLANSVRTLYSTGTVMISVPASTKILHWCVTIIQSSLSCDVGFLFLLAFMYFFVLGGLSGMFVAHLGFDVIFHDTFYVVGHFHVMFACSAMCCIFAAFYFYFSSIFGVRYSRFFAYLHFIFFVVGQLVTIIPMMFVGWAGMPRRIMDYPSIFGGWQSVVSSGHLLIVFSFIFFFCMLLDSVYENKSPISKTKGVSRLNTRLSFFAYEIRKLKYFNGKSQNLIRGNITSSSKSRVYKLSSILEITNFEYVFKTNSKS